MRVARRTWRGALVLAACLAGWSARASTPPSAPEVKAAYLTKFAPFVVWPASAFAAPNAPLVLCIQGQDAFGVFMDQAVAGQSVGAHPVIVRRLARIDPDSGCHIAYLAGSPAQSADAALKVAEGRPVLTVTDADNPGDGRGIVHLVLINGRLQFAIDAAKAGQSGLVISSKLLALASEVKR